MTSKLLPTMVFAFVAIALITAQPNERYTAIEKLYKQKKYEDLISTYNNETGQITGEEYFKIKLMVADACCQTQRWSSGKKMYNHLIHDYKKFLTRKHTNRLKSYQEQCNENATHERQDLPSTLGLFASLVMADATSNVSVSGKEYSFSLHGASSVTKMPKEEKEYMEIKPLEKFPVEDSVRFLQYFKNLHQGKRVQFGPSKYFIICSYYEMPHERLIKLSTELDLFYEYFSEKFNLLKVPYKIAIHIAESRVQMRQLASSLYGLKDIGYSIGLSMMDSYSMLCLIPADPYRYRGTIRHEICHLLLNHNYPFLPPWLAEGLPTLYEATDRSQEQGIPNWRGQIVDQLIANYYRYNVDNHNYYFDFNAFLLADWDQFDGKSEDENFIIFNHVTQSVNYAMARYFVLYLQNTNQLDLVFTQSIQPIDFLDPSSSDHQTRLAAFVESQITWGKFRAWLEDNFPSLSLAKQVQKLLKQQGFYQGNIDGDIGPASIKAIRNYQEKRGLKITGQMDDQTLIALGLYRASVADN